MPAPEISWSFKFWITASASGCSELLSIANKIRLNSCRFSCFASHTRSVTRGFPLVIVPVLSRITTFTLCADSRLSASLINIPFSAPLPTPTIIAVGVAKPKAQGHAITNTVTMANSPCVKPFSPPKIIQAPKLNIEIRITTGTKTPAILSTSL